MSAFIITLPFTCTHPQIRLVTRKSRRKPACRYIRSEISCADPEGDSYGVRTPPPPPPLKIHKNILFSSITGLDSLKNRSYQASIQCWAIIGTPAKRHLMHLMMAFRWRADDGPLIVKGTWILPPLIN